MLVEFLGCYRIKEFLYLNESPRIKSPMYCHEPKKRRVCGGSELIESDVDVGDEVQVEVDVEVGDQEVPDEKDVEVVRMR